MGGECSRVIVVYHPGHLPIPGIRQGFPRIMCQGIRKLSKSYQETIWIPQPLRAHLSGYLLEEVGLGSAEHLFGQKQSSSTNDHYGGSCPRLLGNQPKNDWVLIRIENSCCKRTSSTEDLWNSFISTGTEVAGRLIHFNSNVIVLGASQNFSEVILTWPNCFHGSYVSFKLIKSISKPIKVCDTDCADAIMFFPFKSLTT